MRLTIGNVVLPLLEMRFATHKSSIASSMVLLGPLLGWVAQ